jgi:hypothetical protein
MKPTPQPDPLAALTPDHRVIVTRDDWKKYTRHHEPIMVIHGKQYQVRVSSVGGGNLEARLEKH